MARSFADRLAAAQGGTHALVDLDALAKNTQAVLARLPDDVGLIAVVKANAYGHGLIPCARALLAAGARWLGVARIEEGLALRHAGITAPVLVLGPPNHALLRPALGADLALAVGSTADVTAVAQATNETFGPARVHLKVDTGMRRFGVEPEQAMELAQAIVADPRLELEGLFTHFATADEPDSGFLQEQARRFRAVRHLLARRGIAPRVVHQANSAAALRGVVGEADLPGERLARAGIVLYGLPPSAAVAAPPGSRPVLRLLTRLARVFTVAAGEGISYGHTFIARQQTRCGLAPVGYGDGLSRLLSNRGWFVVRGRRCPIRGQVCMDQTIIEVDRASGVEAGEPTVVLGDGQSGEMTAVDIAGLCGTIPYEVVTGLAARVPRVYLRNGQPVALSDLAGLVEERP
jgi:alanine racemase